MPPISRVRPAATGVVVWPTGASDRAPRGHRPRWAFATLAVGTPIFAAAQGDRVWAKLTAPTRALVALYPTGRVALAGLPGWSWPRWQCETGWLDANTVRIDAPGAPEPGRADAGVAK